MHKYARIIFRKNFLLWTPSIITVCLLSCLVSLCFMHFSWVSQTDFITQATTYKLNLAEFKIISATLYFVILTLSVVSLWLIGKATTKQLCPQFAQWRLLGATSRETIRCNLYFSAYIAAFGGISGAIIACPLSFWVLPKLNTMANGFQPYMIFEYHLPLTAVIGAAILSFLTCLISSGSSAFWARKANPLDLFRNVTSQSKSGRLRIILGFCSLGYTILLVCTLPVIRYLNGGISAVYNLMLHISISGMICVFLFTPALLRIIKKVLVDLIKRQKLGFARVSVFATFDKIEKNNVALIILTSAFTLLTTIYLGTKTLIVAVSKATGLTNFNLSDSFAIALLVALVALCTAFSIITLNFKNERLELAILKSSGLTYTQSKRFVFNQAVVFTGITLMLSTIPISLVSIVGTLGLFLIGIPYIVLDLLPYPIGCIIILSFLSLVLWIPTRSAVKGKWIEAMRQ